MKKILHSGRIFQKNIAKMPLFLLYVLYVFSVLPTTQLPIYWQQLGRFGISCAQNAQNSILNAIDSIIFRYFFIIFCQKIKKSQFSDLATMKLATLLHFDVIEKINTGFRFRYTGSNEINWSFLIHSFF